MKSAGVSSGLAVVAGLGFFNTLNNRYPNEHNDVLDQHRLIEAMKWMGSALLHIEDINETCWNVIKDRYTSEKWANTILDDRKYSDETTFDWEH